MARLLFSLLLGDTAWGRLKASIGQAPPGPPPRPLPPPPGPPHDRLAYEQADHSLQANYDEAKTMWQANWPELGDPSAMLPLMSDVNVKASHQNIEREASEAAQADVGRLEESAEEAAGEVEARLNDVKEAEARLNDAKLHSPLINLNAFRTAGKNLDAARLAASRVQKELQRARKTLQSSVANLSLRLAYKELSTLGYAYKNALFHPIEIERLDKERNLPEDQRAAFAHAEADNALKEARQKAEEMFDDHVEQFHVATVEHYHQQVQCATTFSSLAPPPVMQPPFFFDLRKALQESENNHQRFQREQEEFRQGRGPYADAIKRAEVNVAKLAKKLETIKIDERVVRNGEADAEVILQRRAEAWENLEKAVFAAQKKD